ncbi:MAG TPA: DNA cytosine methyltransferase, partial [Streptosporangiaceae bacterium]|nr:DNA cytosine methyltransferase [Streptosporangiaceae bacterium]
RDWEYDVHEEVLIAADYGSSAARRRLLVVATDRRLGLGRWRVPEGAYSQAALWHDQAPGGRYWARHRIAPRYGLVPPGLPPRDGKRPWRTIRDEIGSLPDPRQATRARSVTPPPGPGAPARPRHHTTWPSRRKVAPRRVRVAGRSSRVYDVDRPMVTVMAGGGEPLLRVQVRAGGRTRWVTRASTHRELLRFQGFPDDVVLAGGPGARRAMIGNAVPLPLGRAVVNAMADAYQQAATAAGPGRAAAAKRLAASDLAPARPGKRRAPRPPATPSPLSTVSTPSGMDASGGLHRDSSPDSDSSGLFVDQRMDDAEDGVPSGEDALSTPSGMDAGDGVLSGGDALAAGSEVARLERGRLARLARYQRAQQDRARQAVAGYRRLVAELGIRKVDVAADGDCYFSSVIVMFGDRLRPFTGGLPPTPQLLRADLVRAVRDDLARADRGEPAEFVHLFFPDTVTGADPRAARARVYRSLTDRTDWNTDAFDSVTQLSVRRWGLPAMTLLGPAGPQHLGPPGQPEAYLWYDGSHYTASRSDYQIVPAEVLWHRPELAGLESDTRPPADPPARARLQAETGTYTAAFGLLRARLSELTTDDDAQSPGLARRGRQLLAAFDQRLTYPPSQDTTDRLGGLTSDLHAVITQLHDGAPPHDQPPPGAGAASQLRDRFQETLAQATTLLTAAGPHLRAVLAGQLADIEITATLIHDALPPAPAPGADLTPLREVLARLTSLRDQLTAITAQPPEAEAGPAADPPAGGGGGGRGRHVVLAPRDPDGGWPSQGGRTRPDDTQPAGPGRAAARPAAVPDEGRQQEILAAIADERRARQSGTGTAPEAAARVGQALASRPEDSPLARLWLRGLRAAAQYWRREGHLDVPPAHREQVGAETVGLGAWLFYARGHPPEVPDYAQAALHLLRHGAEPPGPGEPGASPQGGGEHMDLDLPPVPPAGRNAPAPPRPADWGGQLIDLDPPATFPAAYRESPGRQAPDTRATMPLPRGAARD